MLCFDKTLLDTFASVEIRGEDLDLSGRFTRNLAAVNGQMTYRIRSNGKVPFAGDEVISVQAIRREGALRPCYNLDNYGTDVRIFGKGQPHLYGFIATLSGAMEMVSGPSGSACASGTKGIILRGDAGTRLATSDNTARMVLWIDGARLEQTLAARLGEKPRERLAFRPDIDWNAGPARMAWRMITHLMEELRDPDGVTTEPVAFETFTDLFMQVILRRLEHNHSARLEAPASVAVPGHLRRAEAFMRASADQPITLADVAAAAGCSLGSLQAACRRFRDATALSVLRDIRLHRARETLQAADDEVSTRAIARRFGFTNPSRFIAAYGKRFGERPGETRRSWADDLA